MVYHALFPNYKCISEVKVLFLLKLNMRRWDKLVKWVKSYAFFLLAFFPWHFYQIRNSVLESRQKWITFIFQSNFAAKGPLSCYSKTFLTTSNKFAGMQTSALSPFAWEGRMDNKRCQANIALCFTAREQTTCQNYNKLFRTNLIFYFHTTERFHHGIQECGRLGS